MPHLCPFLAHAECPFGPVDCAAACYLDDVTDEHLERGEN